MNRTQKWRLLAAIFVLPLGVLWLWLGTLVVGEPWLRLWGWFTFALALAAAAYGEHKRNVARSAEPSYLLQGSSGVVVRDLQPEGQIRVGSELWIARVRDTQRVEVGTRVQVCGREGMVLVVEKSPR